MAEVKKNTYSEDSIQVLQGLEAVRKRPGMYIGSTDNKGLHHLIWEIVDNAIDEVLAGEANHIRVIIHKGNTVEVQDNGRGIPIGMHKTGVPTPQVVYCSLHAGGKFDENGAYKVSGGLHGVGSSVVNALSEWLEVEVNRDKKLYYQKYSDGGKKIGKPVVTPSNTKKTGTTVRFKPDPSIFSTTIIDYKQCVTRFKEAAFLIKGLRIDLIDERTGQSDTFCYEEGITEYIRSLNEGKVGINDPVIFEGTNQGISVEVAFQYTKDTYSETLYSFVNNIRTHDGGTHETGFKVAFTKAFNEYARKKNLIKDKDPNLEGVDIREGMTAILSVRIPEGLLQFEGQTKNKLGTAEAKSAVEAVVTEKLGFYLNEKGEIATLLINNAIRAFKVRDAMRQARDEARTVKAKVTKPANLNGKLCPPQSRNNDINELFIVEGDSAGGSAKTGRDRRFQAILPLRGKVLNAERTRAEEMLKNEEIVSLIHAIGAGYGNTFNPAHSNYKKIIIMTDADDDGCHIQILLLTFFFRFMPSLIKRGMVYIALPPLYKIANKNQVEYAWNDDELKEKTMRIKNYTLQRFKGLGEMNPDQLWETTMNPETRILVRVNIEDFSEADERVSVLMGDDVAPRRAWIDNNVVFENDDNFTLEEVDVDGEE